MFAKLIALELCLRRYCKKQINKIPVSRYTFSADLSRDCIIFHYIQYGEKYLTIAKYLYLLKLYISTNVINTHTHKNVVTFYCIKKNS